MGKDRWATTRLDHNSSYLYKPRNIIPNQNFIQQGYAGLSKTSST